MCKLKQLTLYIQVMHWLLLLFRCFLPRIVLHRAHYFLASTLLGVGGVPARQTNRLKQYDCLLVYLPLGRVAGRREKKQKKNKRAPDLPFSTSSSFLSASSSWSCQALSRSVFWSVWLIHAVGACRFRQRSPQVNSYKSIVCQTNGAAMLCAFVSFTYTYTQNNHPTNQEKRNNKSVFVKMPANLVRSLTRFLFVRFFSILSNLSLASFCYY